MSENEKRLRELMEQYTTGGYMTGSVREHLTANLNALLAEHRAEVERLEAQVQAKQEEIERQMAERQREWQGKQNEAEAYRREIAELRGKASSARDAALEEAERAARIVLERDARGPLVHAEREALAQIRALKSQPARQYVDAEEVREAAKESAYGVLWDIDADLTREERWYNKALIDLLGRLGIDLDTKAEQCPRYECDVVPGDACANCGTPLTSHPEPQP